MARHTLLRVAAALALCSTLFVTRALAQEIAPFKASPLVKLGDKMRYGSYTILKIGEGIYRIYDSDGAQPDAKMGALGSDEYLIRGETKALLIDLGNNYVTGYAADNLKPRKNAAEEFRAMIFGLAGGLPLEVTLTHMHPDHDGMTSAMSNQQGVILWVSDKEDIDGLRKQHGLDPSVYKTFTSGEKTFDLGGGRVVTTHLTRGHTNGSTTYILKKDGLVFTGDAWGVGWGRSLNSADQVKDFAVDSKKVIDYINANFSPYERYALKVYPAHMRYVGEGNIRNPKIPNFDQGYFDWRFLQDMASCADGIVKGLWLQSGTGYNPTGFNYVIDPEMANNNPSVRSKPEDRVGYVTFGTGSIIIPLKVAYEAAGLKMPE